MQQEMLAAQESLKDEVVEASAGGGMVTVRAAGDLSIRSITIDPEAVARVARLSRRALQPGGAFWRGQAERFLAAFVWSEGRVPENGRLTVQDVSRDDLDVAAAWQSD